MSKIVGNKSISYSDLVLGNLNIVMIMKLALLGVIFGLAGFIFNLRIL